MIYLHYFETNTEFSAVYNGEDYLEPWVSVTNENDEVNYSKTEEEKLLSMPFTIEALGNGNIWWQLGNRTVQYSKNGGSWETMNSGTTISVVEGDEVQFKGTNTNYSANTISATVPFNVKGNIMSLTNADDFETANSVNASGFTRLFNGCTYLVSASDLKLPATTLAGYCYYGMFENCTSLTAAPELPATTLAERCYLSMFENCTGLTAAPELPATTLANYCYYQMFMGCTSLTAAPELPATTLTNRCYYNMFRNCTNLNYIKCLATDISANNCTRNWVNGVSSTGTFVKNPSMSSWTRGVDGIPTNWTVQDAS